jgi:hypothetical protein
VNVVTSALCWSLWKLRNSIIFQDVAWTGMKALWGRVVPMLRCWKILVPLKLEAGYESVMSSLEKVLRAPVVIETGRRVLGTWLERSGADENCGRVDVNLLL